MAFRKFYVVFEGRAPGIYDSWEECKEQIDGFPGANYRAFQDQDEATEALRRYDSGEDTAIYKAMRRRNTAVVNYAAFPEIDLNGIAVDASCPGNPGPVEYRGVRVGTGEQLFCIGPLQGGTNNIGEYLALVHVAALLKKVGDATTTIYSDSRTAIGWFMRGASNTKIRPATTNEVLLQILARADAWRRANRLIPNPIIKWDTDRWGEIPADFGRK